MLPAIVTFNTLVDPAINVVNREKAIFNNWRSQPESLRIPGEGGHDSGINPVSIPK